MEGLKEQEREIECKGDMGGKGRERGREGEEGSERGKIKCLK